MRIYRKINHVLVEKSGHLIILSDEKPLDGEWAFDYRPDEKGKLHPICFMKQSELELMDTSTERKIIASNSLPSGSVAKIPSHQEELVRERYSDGIPCDVMIEYEEYGMGERIKINPDGFCNVHEVVWDKSQLIFELNHVLNQVFYKNLIKNPNSNTIAEFVDNWMKDKYNL